MRGGQAVTGGLPAGWLLADLRILVWNTQREPDWMQRRGGGRIGKMQN